MKTARFLGVFLITALAVAQGPGRPGRPGGPANGGAGTGTQAGSGSGGAPTQPTAPHSGWSANPGRPNAGERLPPGVTHVTLPPGWGRAPQAPYGNVNHPGGGTLSPGLPGIQPLPTVIQPLPTGLHQTQPRDYYYNTSPYYRGSRRTVYVPVPVYYPAPIYITSPERPVIYTSPEASPEIRYVEVPASQGVAIWGGSEPARPPQISIFSGSTSPPAAEGPLTLLVFKDHSIYAVSSYWKEGDRIAYITSYGSKSAGMIDQLDLEMTRKLNDERSVKFELQEKK